jgi:putative transposase
MAVRDSSQRSPWSIQRYPYNAAGLIRNVLTHVRKAQREAVKSDLHAIQYASGIGKAQMAIGAFARRWQHVYPRAVACLLNDEEHLLSFFQCTDKNLWSQIRTTNAIERRFREVRRRTRPMGVFSDRTSMERILYAVFSYENLRQGVGTPFLAVTQNS